MTEFETLLRQHYGPLERFVRFRMEGTSDAEDLLQDICLTAYTKFPSLRDREKFKPWLLQIAQNRCRDYYRKHRPEQIPLETVEPYLTADHSEPAELVRETLEALRPQDRRLLEMIYFGELPQEQVARLLGIPVGTVKSRLHMAKRRFRDAYPEKGVYFMKKLPEYLPEYTITPSKEPPFPVVWEELQGWMFVPKLGEKLTWGLYDGATRRRTEYTEMKALGKTEIHGIEGIEIQATQHDAEDYYRQTREKQMERRFVAQLTDTHCRFLAESHMEKGVRKVYTFLDGDDFLKNWGFGPDNCGNETQVRPKGILSRQGDTVTLSQPEKHMDVVGRYTLSLGGKEYDTICVMDVETYDDAVVSETYLDQKGRTVLWRRFNRDDWALRFFGTPWTQRFPENQRLTVGGQTYIHWYDAITDYIL